MLIPRTFGIHEAGRICCNIQRRKWREPLTDVAEGESHLLGHRVRRRHIIGSRVELELLDIISLCGEGCHTRRREFHDMSQLVCRGADPFEMEANSSFPDPID
eukprot:GFKZ01006702.1.p2 GENE.GFKZ01006702.1~~GFKZ01006702.1.p2  ORF type:complete len:103 (+),score=3.36 GFKZ01006702.1:371-679(+)